MSFSRYFRDLKVGQIEAILKLLYKNLEGREGVERYLSGEIDLKVEGTVRSLFDHYGRGIPPAGMKGVVDADRAYGLDHSEIDYVATHTRYMKAFSEFCGFISLAEFEHKCKAVISRIRKDARISNLLKGAHFPFILPPFEGDIGHFLNEVLISRLVTVYLAQFSGRTFVNYRRSTLFKRVVVSSGTGQNGLIDAAAKGYVCGVYFPTALHGFGIQASRTFVSGLPRYLMLSGLEVPAAVIGNPAVFGGENTNIPNLDLLSLQWRGTNYSFSLGLGSGTSDFSERIDENKSYCSAGISMIG